MLVGFAPFVHGRGASNSRIGSIIRVMDPAFVVAALGGTDCERIGAGWLAQPANAASSLAYVVAGVWLLRRALAPGTDSWLLFGAGAALAAVGVGSVAFHGPQPVWAGTAHDAAIWSLPAVVGAHIAWRGLASRRFGAVRLGGRRWRVAGAWAAVGLAAYIAGRTGSSWCRPDSLWQFHAVWHLCSAAALGSAVLALAGAPSRWAEPVLQMSEDAARVR